MLANEKHPNILWILLDDISTERFPESGNTALQGLLPGWDRLKSDPNTVYYEHFYSPSSMCAPSQVALFSGMEPADIGGQYQLSTANIPGKAPYATVPPPEVKFLPEILREMGFWSSAGGKLDYQVAEVIPTFYNKVLGGAFSDVTSYQDGFWDPAIEMGRPFFGMINLMDMHQLLSTFSREIPIPVSNPKGGLPPLPFGPLGYALPLSLLFEGPDGNPTKRSVVGTNLEDVDIVGYDGSFNETVLNHENGGVPGYLPDEIGIKSILAREYDLIRNVDYRLEKVIEALEERGVYNDTMIVVFGDHGSATYKGKALLEPQSVRTPLWIKYPEGTQLPDAVRPCTTGVCGLVDDRMTSILDLFPTTLSVLGVEPPAWIKAGLPLAGKHAVERTRDVMYAIVQRISSITGWKSFAAFTKDFYYQRNMVNENTIATFKDAVGTEDELAALLGSVPMDSRYERRFDIFAASPIFDRVKRLLKVNAVTDPEFVKTFGPIAADEATAPPEVFYNLEVDPYGTRNLIVNYTYDLSFSESTLSWGNNISSIHARYDTVREIELCGEQRETLHNLRTSLDCWIASQKWV